MLGMFPALKSVRNDFDNAGDDVQNDIYIAGGVNPTLALPGTRQGKKSEQNYDKQGGSSTPRLAL